MPRQRSKSTNNYGLDMRFFSWLKNWLFSSKEDEKSVGHPDLEPIDVGALADELKLEEHAKRLGQAGTPRTNTTVLSGPEASVVHRIEQVRQKYANWGVLRLSVLNQTFARCDATQEINRARQADKEFERKASALLTEKESILRALKESANSKRAELVDFKTRNGLKREAHFPSASKSFVLYSMLFLLILLEGGLNATLFAQGMDSGLIGGFGLAAILAVINVGIAYLMGRFLIGFSKHKNLPQKIFGFLSILLSIAWLIGMALNIGHFRDALTSGSITPASDVLEQFKTSPLDLKDAFSWILFAASAIFGVFAIFDGLHSDESYPGYSAVYRRYSSAVEGFEAEIDDLRVALEKLKDEELDALDKISNSAQANIAVYESTIDDKRMAASMLDNSITHANNALDALIGVFRTENDVARGEVPRPAYFDMRPELMRISLPDFDTSVDKQALDEQKASIKLLVAETQDIRAKIQAGFNQHFDRLKPLDHQFSKEI